MKSTDDSMLDTLTKMGGKRHESYKSSRNLTKDIRHRYSPSDGKISESVSVQEVPVISNNDMLLIPKSNSIVFGRGNPIWNRNETVLPMAWKLHREMPHASGIKKYQLNTVPSSSHTDDFDILGNQPNFFEMVSKRVAQARKAKAIRNQYMKIYNLTEDQMEKIDPDTLAQQLMEGINDTINYEDTKIRRAKMASETELNKESTPEQRQQMLNTLHNQTSKGQIMNLTDLMQKTGEDNTALKSESKKFKQERDDETMKRYAHHKISRANLMVQGKPNHQFDSEIKDAYQAAQPYFAQDSNFKVNKYGSLFSSDGQVCYIESVDDPETDFHKDKAEFDKQNDPKNGVYDQTTTDKTDDLSAAQLKYDVKDTFYKYLYERPDWSSIARNSFDDEMSKAYDIRNQTGSAI